MILHARRRLPQISGRRGGPIRAFVESPLPIPAQLARYPRRTAQHEWVTSDNMFTQTPSHDVNRGGKKKARIRDVRVPTCQA